MRSARINLLILMCLLFADPAWAACTLPAANAGAQEWFAADLNYKLCDGTNWKAFAATIPGHGGIAAGTDSTCGLKADNTAWCWGSDAQYQIGNGATTGTQHSPVAVSGGATWKKLSGAGETVCGIKTDGTAWCWGRDFSEGNLGDGENYLDPGSDAPVAVSGGGTWKEITAGYFTTCGIKSDNSAWCWASDGMGQLGNGTTTVGTDAHEPVAVSGGLSWKSIDVSFETVCGVTTAGALYCWGKDFNLQVGDDAVAADKNAPTAVSGGGTWLMATTGNSHSCGIKTDGTAWCWGSDYDGELGNGATGGDQGVPNAVAGGHTWKFIDAGTGHTCAIKSDDTLWCWGGGGNGQLGHAGGWDDPVQVTGGGTWKTVSAGGAHTCAIKMDDTLWCWGKDVTGQVGNGSASSSDQTSPVSISSGWTQGEASQGTACTATAEMEYITAEQRFRICDGVYYKYLKCAAGNCGSLGACTVAGQIDYFPGTKELAWCDGSTWKVMAR